MRLFATSRDTYINIEHIVAIKVTSNLLRKSVAADGAKSEITTVDGQTHYDERSHLDLVEILEKEGYAEVINP